MAQQSKAKARQRRTWQHLARKGKGMALKRGTRRRKAQHRTAMEKPGIGIERTTNGTKQNGGVKRIGTSRTRKADYRVEKAVSGQLRLYGRAVSHSVRDQPDLRAALAAQRQAQRASHRRLQVAQTRSIRRADTAAHSCGRRTYIRRETRSSASSPSGAA